MLNYRQMNLNNFRVAYDTFSSIHNTNCIIFVRLLSNLPDKSVVQIGLLKLPKTQILLRRDVVDGMETRVNKTILNTMMSCVNELGGGEVCF